MIAKHAHANEVTLILAHDAEGVYLVIKDNGTGFDTSGPVDPGQWACSACASGPDWWRNSRRSIRARKERRYAFEFPSEARLSGHPARNRGTRDARQDARIDQRIPSMNRLRILIADDHAILREGLCALINGQPDMEVVTQAGTGREAVRLAIESNPDVAVLDVSMPDMGGPEAAEQMMEHCPSVRVLALTRHADQAYLRRLLQAGACGYVLKKSAADTLINAIRIVAQGSTYIEPNLAGPLLQRTFSHAVPGRRVNHPDVLSAREEEVLQGIAWGRSNKEIAASLSLSIKTVEILQVGCARKIAFAHPCRHRTLCRRRAVGWPKTRQPD